MTVVHVLMENCLLLLLVCRGHWTQACGLEDVCMHTVHMYPVGTQMVRFPYLCFSVHFHCYMPAVLHRCTHTLRYKRISSSLVF